MGTLFLALSTSLPELVVSAQAVRMGFWDMAAGNIFGSNMLNMALIPIVSMFFDTKPGGLFSLLSNLHIFTMCLAVILTAVIIVQLKYRLKKKLLGLNWEIWTIGIFYTAGTIVVFYLR
jgi:cation:H+ antiporter